MIARFIIAAASRPFSPELQICIAVLCGLTIGVMLGTSGRL